MKAAETAYGPQLKNALLKSFKGKMTPAPVSSSYRLGLVFVAFFMVLLPLIYVALIVLVAWLTCWHAVENITILNSRASLWGFFLLYGTPLVSGVLLVITMVKPLFAKRLAADSLAVLTEKEEPVLFAFVRRLCRVVGAPVPNEIALDNDVNASASFRRGFSSIFSRDLRLTIGLPLAAGLSVNQFAGVLAHEFGHFAQTTGMGLTYVIRSINGWFYQVVYQRDNFDAFIDKMMASSGGVIALGLLIAKGLIWLVRKLLWVLMHLGHFVSCFMLRQMEFDADRYEARLVGGDIFETTAREIHHLALSSCAAQEDQRHFWEDGKLCNDISKLTLFHRKKHHSILLQESQKNFEEAKTRWFDTHPCDRERAENARREGNHPNFFFEGPARLLFRQFDKTSQDLTERQFKQHMEIKDAVFRNIDELKEGQDREIQFLQARDRCFQFACTPYYLPELKLNRVTPSEDQDSILSALEKCRTAFLEGSKEHIQAARKFQKAFDRVMRCSALLAADEANLKLDLPHDDIPARSIDALRELKSKDEQVMAEAVKSYKTMDRLLSERLSLSLSLLVLPEVKGSVDPKLLAEYSACIKTHRLFNEHWELLLDWRRERALVLYLVGPGFLENNEEHYKAFEQHCRQLLAKIKAYRQALRGRPYPFEHSNENMDLKEYVLPTILSMEDPGEILGHAENGLVVILSLINRTHSRFAAIIESVESFYGLEPLPAPDEKLSDELWTWGI